jgi:hypothetical protein
MKSRVRDAFGRLPSYRRGLKPPFSRWLPAILLGAVTVTSLFLTAPLAARGLALRPAPPRWRSLTPPTRRLLRPFAPRWRHLPARRRRVLLRAAHRWLRVPPAQRRRILARLRRWRRLPRATRRRLWKRYRAFRRLPPAERRRILHAYRLFRQLPAWKRRLLLRRWRRRHGRRGPGADESFIHFLPALTYRTRLSGTR